MNHLIPLITACGLPIAAALAQPCGAPWSVNPDSGPSNRPNPGVVYDSGRGKVVLFGGFNAATYFAETWEWTATGPAGGGTWALRSTAGPSGRSHAGLAYDSVRQKTVLFGGVVAAFGYNNQTWEWDGTSWTQIFPVVSPPNMPGVLMAYDASRQRTVLVSALDVGSGGGFTWEYDGTIWTSFAQNTPPVINYNYFSLAYDAARSTMVLVGPAYTAGSSGENTWERTASGWILRDNNTLTGFSSGACTTYDPVRQQVLFIDNQAYSNTTGVWGWNGALAKWQTISSGGPSFAIGRPPVFDAAGGQLVLLGGGQTRLFRSDMRDGPTLTDIGPRSIGFDLNGPLSTLSVAATGTPPITYRWRLNRVELSDTGAFSGTGTPQLTIDPTDIVYTGLYDALVTDACGTTFRPATSVRIECYANCDGSTASPVLNAEDFQCFLNMYASHASYANCDGSTAPPVLNAIDFQCFMNQYAIGCH